MEPDTLSDQTIRDIALECGFEVSAEEGWPCALVDWICGGQTLIDFARAVQEEAVRRQGPVRAAAPEMYEALKLWDKYDSLLRSLPGPGPLYGNQMAAVDAAYDACVASTEKVLAKAEGR